jgi:GMP synthase (glutamine-hydrolysing)
MKEPRVLALQHVAVEPPANIGIAITRAGGSVDVVRIDQGQAVPANLDGYAGLLIMGGPMGVYEADKYPHLAEERRLIASAIERRAPILGICLGSQLLASALGAPVRPGPRKEIGWYPVTLTPAAASDPLLAGLPATFTPLHWHGDIFDLPPGAVALARSELTAHQAFSFGGHAFGLLFHLEVTADKVADMSAAFAEELAQVGVDPAQLARGFATHGATAEALAADVFGRWMGLVAASAAAR